jgi:hypothetical protein
MLKGCSGQSWKTRRCWKKPPPPPSFLSALLWFRHLNPQQSGLQYVFRDRVPTSVGYTLVKDWEHRAAWRGVQGRRCCPIPRVARGETAAEEQGGIHAARSRARIRRPWRRRPREHRGAAASAHSGQYSQARKLRSSWRFSPIWLDANWGEDTRALVRTRGHGLGDPREPPFVPFENFVPSCVRSRTAPGAA